jgi:hypothetical protein
VRSSAPGLCFRREWIVSSRLVATLTEVESVIEGYVLADWADLVDAR